MFEFQLAVISDIHGNRWALEAVLEDIHRRGIQHIVNLGDCLYGPLDPAGTARMLIPLNIPTVCGNEDRIVIKTPDTNGDSPMLRYVKESLDPGHLQWLKALEMTTVVHEDIFLCHGSPAKDDEYLLVEVLASGVSHQRPEEHSPPEPDLAETP